MTRFDEFLKCPGRLLDPRLLKQFLVIKHLDIGDIQRDTVNSRLDPINISFREAVHVQGFGEKHPFPGAILFLKFFGQVGHKPALNKGSENLFFIKNTVDIGKDAGLGGSDDPLAVGVGRGVKVDLHLDAGLLFIKRG